mgnify:CR=1 FL=1
MKIKIFVNEFGNSDINEIVELPKNQSATNSLESLGLNFSEQQNLLTEAYKKLIMPKEVE